mmetsp:Transcript_8895/g.19976  ORF Transcript_8895/g.19976 Transcript_8895/m.19976 type:complete len:349 (+) Transcript_8895:33-1079(+)
MQWMDIDYSKLPERIQRAVDGVGAPPASCGHCRQPASLRCARCKVTKYCSAACQKEHFKFHKKGCKSIKEKRDALEKDLQQKKHVGVSDDSTTIEDKVVEKMLKLGELLIAVGYRESDTIVHGSLYYREALKYFVMPRRYIHGDFHRKWEGAEDVILLLLVILGGDDGTIQEWCLESGTQRVMNYLPAENPEAISLGLQIQGYAEDDVPFQAVLLLSLMKLLANYRRDLAGLAVYKETMQNAATAIGCSVSIDHIFEHVSSYLMGDTHDGKIEMEILPDSINTVISAIRYHGNESHLVHLRDTIPLTSDHAPKLFIVMINELWMIFQDCFFETPGLNDILHEFFPEED